MKSQHSIHMYTTLIRNLSWDETRERKVSVVLAGGLVEPGGVQVLVGLPAACRGANLPSRQT